MNLKEAFRFQNKLSQIINDAVVFLTDETNIVSTKMTHLKSKVVSEHKDEVEKICNEVYKNYDINKMIDFICLLMDEKEKLCAAIRDAKRNSEFDIDSAVEMNVKRQAISSLFRNMSLTKPSETILKNEGVGFKFNSEGNQTPYHYDIKKVVTINFDRNKVKKLASALSTAADEDSKKIDMAMIQTIVEYEPVFDVNASFEEIFEAYQA